jgi:hypothetical protein
MKYIKVKGRYAGRRLLQWCKREGKVDWTR